MKNLAAAAFGILVAASTVWSGEISDDHPDGILCEMPATAERPEGVVAFYLSALLADGRVLYQTLGNQVLSLTFDEKGQPVVDSGQICGGKSLSVLKADGLTF